MLNTSKLNDHFASTIKSILFLLLLIGGIFFSRKAIDEYCEWRTTFDVSYVPITFDDLPVLTIASKGSPPDYCHAKSDYALAYDIYINNDSKRFELNASLNPHSGLINLEEYCYEGNYLRVLTLGQDLYKDIRLQSIGLTSAKLELSINITNTTEEIHLGISSPDSVYSEFDLEHTKSFDGKLGFIHLNRGRYYMARLNIEQTEYAKDGCSMTPFYETLGAELKVRDFTAYNLSYQKEPFKPCPTSVFDMCLNRAFPIDIPKCGKLSASTMGICFEEALNAVKNEMFKAADDSKSCIVKGYFMEDEYEWQPKAVYHSFYAYFDISAPTSTVHIRTNKVLKTMRREYYVMTEIGLIGALGGTLGLFVGLSFLDIVCKAMDWAIKCSFTDGLCKQAQTRKIIDSPAHVISN